MKGKKIEMAYSYGNHDSKVDTLILTISGTGIDLAKSDHSEMVKTVLEIAGAHLYAKAHGIGFDKIVTAKIFINSGGITDEEAAAS